MNNWSKHIDPDFNLTTNARGNKKEFNMNKWSTYIDKDFNFSNKVNTSTKGFDEKIGMFRSNNLSLDPRLQEYIKKKKYYSENNIEVDVPLEKEYGITQSDTIIIKNFMRGNTKIYDNKVLPKILKSDNVSVDRNFPSKYFRDDEQKNYGYKKRNISEFDPKDKVELKRRDINEDEILDFRDLSSTYNSGTKGFKIDDTRFDPRIDSKVQRVKGNSEEYSRFMSQYKIIDGNKKFASKSDLQNGIPTKTRKSYGYADLEEHNYQYIDNKCGSGDDSSLSRSGQSSRLDNRMKTNYERTIS